MIQERNEAFGVRVYRGQERGYEWIGTFKFRDYGGRRAARKAAEQAEAEARFRGNAKARRALTIEAYVARYLDDYRERQKESAYVTASSRLAPFRRAEPGRPSLAHDRTPPGSGASLSAERR